MKKTIKKFIPAWLLRWHKNRLKNKSKFRDMDPHDVFTEIYKSNHWQSSESISGTGSELKQTETLINDLNKLFKDKNITTVLDLPCGDFKWMQKVNLSTINYIGGDIVEALVENNIKQYKDYGNLTFKVINLIADPLPVCDIIIVRDCLVHLSYKDINSAIENIKSSGCKYLLTTTFTKKNLNHDIATGEWRPINLQQKPFSFPAPELVINENCTEENEEFKDKSMALWEISKL